MKSQERRDDETVTIFAGLLLFVLVTAVGAAVLVLLHKVFELKGDVLNVLLFVVLGCAVATSVRYLYRHRGR